MPEFSPNEVRVAIAPMSNPTAKSFAYTAELYLGLPKAASSGVISFSLAPGETREISFPVTMPDVEGTYPVYLDVFSEGELIGAYQAVEDVVIAPVGVAEFVYVSGIRRSREEIGSSLYFILEVDVQNQGSIGGTCTLALYCSFRSFYSGGPMPDYTDWEIARGGLSQYEVLQAYIGPGQIVTFRGLVDFYEYFERADHTVMRVKFVGDPGEIVSSGFLVRED